MDRIEKALKIAKNYGGIDGAHHKTWTIDQMCRALTGCPLVEVKATDHKGNPYTYHKLGESEEYYDFIREVMDGEDGPDTYEWDEGIPP
jgi:hypothetical protein